MGSTHSQINFNKQLLSLIRKGKNEQAIEVLNNSDLYHSVDASGATLLHYAARYGNYCLTQFLISKGCHIDAQDNIGYTPLMIAVEGNHEGVTRVLLAFEANVFLLNSEKKSVLHMLPKCTSHRLLFYICQLFLQEMQKECLTVEEIAEKLINAGFQIYLAAYSLNCKIIKYMLKRGYSVNSKHSLSKSTALHAAVYFYHLDSVKTLLESGADAKALDAENASPLHHLYKSFEDHSDMVKILKTLLSVGVSPTFCSSKGYFAIGYTLIRGDSEAIREVLQKSPNFTAVDKIYGRTFLHYLAQNVNPGVAEELLKLNIWYDVNAVDKLGHCPLYFAAVEGNVDMTRLLLDKGADPNPGQHIPLYYAYTRSRPKMQDEYNQCIELLLQHGADPQFLMRVRQSGGMITIFDAALERNDLDGLNHVIAELSIVERLGRHDISDTIRSKINDNPSFNEYFNKCRRLIAEEFFGSITLFKLLISDYSTMDRYLNNTRLLKEIELFCLKHDVKSCYSYIYNKWEKHYLEAKEYRRLKHNVTEVICKIFGNCVDDNNCITHNIIKYLDIRSLRQLALL